MTNLIDVVYLSSCFFKVKAVIMIATPKKERIKKEVLRLVSSAIKPMIGGPINSPIMPMEETAAIATGGGNFFDLPAALKTSGMPGETPMPTNSNPIVAGTR